MIKKADLRSEFERIVKTKKTAVFVVPHWRTSVLPIADFYLSVVKVGSSFCVVLEAISQEYRNDDGFVVQSRTDVASSYPLRSYKSAYQTLVRL